MKKLSIIIPVYNEEKFIGKTLSAASASNSLNLQKEVITIDDGSTDKTLEFIEKSIGTLKSKYKNISFKILRKKITREKVQP